MNGDASDAIAGASRERALVTRLVDAALDYAAHGWPVFPCAPHGKTPLTAHGLKDATTDPDTIRAWWQQWPDANVAIVTGAVSGTVVLDVDADKDGEATLELLEGLHEPLPDTLRAITGGDGWHILFAHPGREVRNTAGRLGPGIDTRGDGGYIIAPPSVHPSGRPYEWLVEPGDAELAPMPDWMLELLDKPTTPPAAPSNGARVPFGVITPYAAKALEERAAEVARAAEGTRNHTLNAAAFRMGQLVAGGQIPRADVESTLAGAAHACGLGEIETSRTITSGLDAAATDPQYPDRPLPAPPATMTPSSAAVGDVDEDQVVGEHNKTDVGNAKRLVAAHGDRFRYVPQWGAWLAWDGTRWARDTTGEIQRAAKDTVATIFTEAAIQRDRDARKALVKHAFASESDARIRAMINQASTELPIPVEPHVLDADPWLLNVLNGTVDLRTGDLHPHDPAGLHTKLAPVVYDPDARSETWDRFLDTTTDGDHELAAFLARAVGYSLTGSTAEEVLFFVHGPTAAGKSTFNDAIEAALGDYARRADFESFLTRSHNDSPRGDIARLAGARFVNSVEVDEGKRLAEGLIKTLTGGDTITARFLYRDEFEFRPAFKLWLVANHAPKVRHGDEALWRRILRIPFEHVIPAAERDPGVKAQLRDPALGGRAVLAWAVAGALAWQADGLQIPASVARATEAYRADMDPLGDFLEDHCVRENGAWVTYAHLRERYEEWAKEQGLKTTLSPKAFKDVLEEHGCVAERRRLDGKQCRVWSGIRLLNIGEQPQCDARAARDLFSESLSREEEDKERYPEDPSHPARASHLEHTHDDEDLGPWTELS